MNNKGNMAMVGTLVVLFVGVIVCLAIYSGGITENIGAVTLTKDVATNTTVTFPTAGTLLVLNGQAISNLKVTNSTSGAVVPTTNYTITNYDVSNGNLAAGITGKGSAYAGKPVNVTYTYEPVGYATDSGSRAIVQLIAILAVLAIVAVVIKKIYDDGLFDSFK